LDQEKTFSKRGLSVQIELEWSGVVKHLLFGQPNRDLGRLPLVGHCILRPGTWTPDELSHLLAEAKSSGPKWGNIFNHKQPPAP
jgi:hypothetical protein